MEDLKSVCPAWGPFIRLMGGCDRMSGSVGNFPKINSILFALPKRGDCSVCTRTYFADNERRSILPID
jgi:hypothetical protein